MNKFIILSVLTISLILLAFSCEEDNKPGSGLIGSWTNKEIDDSTSTYVRVDKLENEYGFSFNENNIFIERKNSGWCGTPPISYSDFEGTWIQSDSIINIEVAYWGGTEEYTWKIMSINDNSLTIKRLYYKTYPDTTKY